MFSIRSTEIIPVNQNLIPIIFSELRFAEYFQMAIVTVLVYDTVTTLDKEIKYFWSSPRKPVSLIYFASIPITSTADCSFTLLTAVISNWITINMIDYILVMRVLALFCGDKVMTTILRVLFVIEAASMFAILAYVQIYNGTALGVFGENFKVCQSVRSVQPTFFVLAWGIPLFYELLLMVLAIYKAASYWSMSEGFSGFHLVKILLMDQAVYFALATFCNVAMIISDTTTNPQIVSKVILGIIGSPSLLVVLGARLLVHLKEAGEKGVNEGTSYRVETLSGIDFA